MKKVFCDKCKKWHYLNFSDAEKFVICPNKRCGFAIWINLK